MTLDSPQITPVASQVRLVDAQGRNDIGIGEIHDGVRLNIVPRHETGTGQGAHLLVLGPGCFDCSGQVERCCTNPVEPAARNGRALSTERKMSPARCEDTQPPAADGPSNQA
jgi:hypothetical protein